MDGSFIGGRFPILAGRGAAVVVALVLLAMFFVTVGIMIGMKFGRSSPPPLPAAAPFVVGKGGGPALLGWPPTHGEAAAYVLDVHDGDTMTVGLLVGCKVRLAGVNAPEVKMAQLDEHGGGWRDVPARQQPEADAARDRLAAMTKGKVVRLVITGPDKYFGRVVAWVYPDDSGRSANQVLVDEGLVKPWDGHGKKPE